MTLGLKHHLVAALSLALVLGGFAACASRRGSEPYPGRKSGTGAQSANPGAGEASAGDITAGIQAWIDGRYPEAGAQFTAERSELNALYRSAGYSPLWLDSTDRPSRNARDAMNLLDSAHDDGLDPADYYGDLLDRLEASLETGPRTPRDLAHFDVALSSAMLSYLHDLHLGRVSPLAIGFRLNLPVAQHDFAALLGSALASHRISRVAAGLRPPLAQYRDLTVTLARYRALAADESLQSPPPASGMVQPGDRYEAVGILRRWLVALGDLPAGAPIPAEANRFAGDVVDGVRHFQLRHGLEPDGVLGRMTMAALRVPLAWRVRQIELALERLRWLPHLGDERLIVINIPMFRLWAWDAVPPSGAPSLGMDVIVGRALGTQTPVFMEHMREIILRPIWNVPRSILRREILPVLRRDPDYLRRENMEIVPGSRDDAQPVEINADNIALLGRGVLRVRQLPGPGNALGLIKFVFPNDENVYLHGTPAQELFARSRRDFSHGCVRVEDPVTLAAWALKDQREWSRDGILAAMAGSETIAVKLERPIQVILFYTTAAVMPEDGTVRFAEDIYGHDARLDEALSGGQGSLSDEVPD